MPISIFNIYKGQIKIDLEMIITFIESTYTQNEIILEEIDKGFSAYYETIEKDDQLLSYLEDKAYIHNKLFNKHLFNSYFSILTSFFESSLNQIYNFYYELNPLDSVKLNEDSLYAEKSLIETLKINLADLKEDLDKILYYKNLRNLLVHCDSNLNYKNKKYKNLIAQIKKDPRINIDKQTNEIIFTDLSCVIEYKSTIQRFFNSLLDQIS